MEQRTLGRTGPADRTESIATIHAALDAGVTLLDTGDFYGMDHNEMLIGEAIASRPRSSFQVSVKLGLDHIDIYRPARLDPAVPTEDTIGAIADMVKAGRVLTSACRKWARQPFAVRRQCTRSPTCRSSIR
jgi:aryl-alcohol dehydrogenase-like predicted oxidoreductase